MVDLSTRIQVRRLKDVNKLAFIGGVSLSALSLLIFSIPLINDWLCSDVPPTHACIVVPPAWPALLIMPIGLVLVGYSFRSHPTKVGSETSQAPSCRGLALIDSNTFTTTKSYRTVLLRARFQLAPPLVRDLIYERLGRDVPSH